MRVWVLFVAAPWFPVEQWSLYETFDEAARDAAWHTVGAYRRGSACTVTEAWLSSTRPGAVVTVETLPKVAPSNPG